MLWNFKKENIFLGTVYLTEQVSFEEYTRKPGTNFHMEILSEAIKHKKQLQKMTSSDSLKAIREENGFGAEFVFMALELFNHTCRIFSRINNIPFISPPHTGQRKGFLISEGYARFNHGLRNPCSFINIANFVYFLKWRKFLLTNEELLQYLPKI